MTSCHLVQVSVICQGFNSPELPWVELWWDWQQQPSLNCHAAGSDSWLGSPYWLGPAHTCSAHNLLWLEPLSWVLMLAGSVQTLWFAENRNEGNQNVRHMLLRWLQQGVTDSDTGAISQLHISLRTIWHTCQGRNNFENRLLGIMQCFINFT